MRTLYLDCGMGAAGDMLTAALSELLPDQDAFFEKMNALVIPGVHFEKEKTQKCGITGTHSKVTVNGEEEESLDVHDHHHDYDHHHDHDHDHDHDEHEHHHHHHGDGECDDPECACHHHHHHADEVFTSWGAETPKQFTQADIDRILTALDSGEYGAILRAKGIVPAADGQWLHFDYVPQEHEVRYGAADYTGRLCVIGSQLKEDGLKTLFGL